MPRIEKKLLLAALAVSIVTLFSSPVRADDAATLYKSKCAMCHGADGRGETPAGKKMGVHDFGSPEVQGMKDAELASAISDGKNKMPAYKKSLSADQIKDLVTYVRSFGKK
jgi:mono/diheme cytochrome c family protein